MKNRKLILIVEDEYDIGSTLELALSMEDHDVILTSHGNEALETLKTGITPDLIISDVMMPLMDGYELLRNIRQHKSYQEIPFILMSAAQLDEKKVDRKAYSYFIRKPFDLDEVLNTIEKSFK